MLGLILQFLLDRWASIGIFLASMAVLYSSAVGVLQTVTNLIGQANAVAGNGAVGELSSAASFAVSSLSLVNYIIPLDLLVAMLGLYFPFFLLCATIRFVKSFVPTIS